MAAPLSPPPLAVDSLQKAWAGRAVVGGVSFSVNAGAVVGLLGPNGCVKSTGLNIVCQLLQADAGQVQLMGEPLRQSGARARVGMYVRVCRGGVSGGAGAGAAGRGGILPNQAKT